jgi:hypothetical protein
LAPGKPLRFRRGREKYKKGNNIKLEKLKAK